ncbi:MAG: hypothetical protein LBF44_00525, partial [Holosporaceae bacterium]|nr:hypothetical protein [Holosporaceae bacterium]
MKTENISGRRHKKYIHDMKSNKFLANFPKVTVITVVYNLIESKRERFFRQCVESVQGQTYPNIEHIII